MHRSLSPHSQSAKTLEHPVNESLRVSLSPLAAGTEEGLRQFAAAAPARRPAALDLDHAGPGGDLRVRRWEEELLDRP
jgi:hypothetical protein